MPEELENPRIEAAKSGERRYQGKPCPHGHGTERYTTSGGCVECVRIAATENRKEIKRLLDQAG